MKVLITRPRAQSASFAEALAGAGFEPVFFPVIDIHPIENNAELDRAIEHLEQFDWVVFTSANGVDVFFQRFNAIYTQAGLRTVFATTRLAAIGPKTAEALLRHGVNPDFIPQEFIAEAILPGLGDLVGRNVLLPRAEISRKALPEAISAAGGFSYEIAVYRTLPAEVEPSGLEALKSGVDVVTFTSSSTVKNFVEILRRQGLDPFNIPGHPVIACIGPITQRTARELGFAEPVMAEEYTTRGLVNLLQSFTQE
jgi:uroporphyrinogen-III synthase